MIKNIIEWDYSWSFDFFQSCYMESDGLGLKPNVVLMRPGKEEIHLEVNSDGFKGKEIDHNKKKVAVWGDSVIFGVGHGWVDTLSERLEGFHFINGGIEGNDFKRIAHRVKKANEKHEIDYNIIFPGWHTLYDPRLIRKILIFLSEIIPNCIFCTIPTSLNENAIKSGLENYFVSKEEAQKTDKQTYYFWGSLEFTKKNALQLLKRVSKANRIITKTASQLNVPLIDWAAEFDPLKNNDFREDFFDAGHPRPEIYSKIINFFESEFKFILSQ